MRTIEIEGLGVRYTGFELGPLHLSIPAGITAVLGPNGSGKTTLLRAVNGLVPGATGRAVVDGTDLTKRVTRAPAHIVFIPDSDELLFPELSLGEFWSFYADVRERAYGDDADGLLCRAFEYADRLHLDPGRTRLREFSLGMRRKTQLITGFMVNPSVLMVDEPQNGLDFVSSHEVRRILTEMRSEGATILMSNHDLDSVARMADRIVVLRGGRIVGRSQHGFESAADCERYVEQYFCDA